MTQNTAHAIADESSRDEELVQCVLTGDEAAFRVIVDRYAGRIHVLIAGMVRDRAEVDDVVQDVFFKVYRKLSGFAGKSSFYTWLYRVAFNTATDHLKRKRHDRSRSLDDVGAADQVADQPNPGKGLDHQELRVRMAAAITELPEKYRTILVLREYEDCSYEAIAAILQCSKGTVESRLFRARARLREKLKGFFG